MTPPIESDELTRKERREQARAERKAQEEAARARDARRRRMTQIGGGIAALIVIAVVLVVALGSGGGKSGTAASSSTSSSGSLPGLQTTSAPWAPEYNNLAARLQAMNLPTESDAAYHIHAHLAVYVNGKSVPVPNGVGADPQGQFLAPLHTHDATGVIHMESSQTYPFTLGQFFDVWGVKFTTSQLGGYTAGNGNVLQVYVNGKPVTNGPSHVMNPHDVIVVGYGKPGSFPTNPGYTFSSGL